MANTTNFGWETPDDTDLVKDGAAAIRTLGSAIDTSLLDLKGGTTDQVLAKNSNTDLDFKWVAQDDSNAIQNAIIDAKGDLIVGTAADTPARLASSATNGDILTVDTSTASGLKWATPTAATSGLTLITTASFSGSSAVNLNNIFTSTYTNYKVVWLYNGSGNVATLFRLRASGTDNTSNNYMWGISGIQYTGNAGYNEAINGVLEPYWKIGFHGGAYDATWVADIFNPQATAVTSYVGGNVNPAASSPNVYGTTTTGVISVTTSYDGMTIYPASGTITGTYWIYGYQKA